VLILSEFAGAADELTDALQVNPYDVDAIAARIREAIEMPPELRAQRMHQLRARVRANNLERWSANFLSALVPERRGEPLAERAAAAN
jgi:trehalose 6-phosphate synthase